MTKLPDDFRLYDLRHSCATLLLVAGENPKVVSERLGHASIMLTLERFTDQAASGCGEFRKPFIWQKENIMPEFVC